MKRSKKSLKDEIRNGTSLLEIIGENIDVHVEFFYGSYYQNKKQTRKEIIKIIIDDLNSELKEL
jgi:hypothetical protein